MSKFRRASLDSKWKLNKELNDYKQHKENKKSGGAGYLEEPAKVKHRPKRGKWKCKKTKGDHIWKYVMDKKRAIFWDEYYLYECEKCGKHNMKNKFLYKCADCGSFESWFWCMISNREDKPKCRKCGSFNIKKILQPIKYERTKDNSH